MIDRLVNVMKKNIAVLTKEIEKYQEEIEGCEKEINSYKHVINLNETILNRISYALVPSSKWKKIDTTKMEERKAYLVRNHKTDKYPMVAEFVNGKLRSIHWVADAKDSPSSTANFAPTEVYLPKSQKK